MKMEIMILNTMKYEKDGQQKSRMGYILSNKEAFSERDKFRGYSELAVYRDDTKLFDLIPGDFIGKSCFATVQERPSTSNPLKSYKEIIELVCNGKTVRLV